MNLFDCILTNSTCYKNTGNKNMTVLGVMLHDTAAGNPYISRYVQPLESDSNYDAMLKKLGVNRYGNDWNHVVSDKGVNAVIGKLADGTVATCHTLPYNYKPWGCGTGSKGSCNNGWIQFEMCDDGYASKEYCEKVYCEAVEYVAYLCKKFNLNPMGTATYKGVKIPVITCHADAHALGFATGHDDIHGWWDKFGKTMDDFRNDVVSAINISNTPVSTKTTATTSGTVATSATIATTTTSALSDTTLGSGVYVVTASAGVNVRKGNSTSKDKVKSLSKGTYISVSEVKNGWGKIATQNWVCLDYCQKKNSTKYKVTASALNVRKGAGTSYAKVGSLSKDTIVYAISTSGEWTKIVSGYTVGFVSTKYITKA